MTTTEARLTYDDVASAINRSRRYVQRHAPEWPHHKFGRFYRFSEDDLAAIIKQHQQTPKVSARQQRQTDPSRPIGYGSRRRPA